MIDPILVQELASRFVITLILQMRKLRFRGTLCPTSHGHLHSHSEDPSLLISVRCSLPSSAKNLGKYPIKVPKIRQLLEK